MFGVACPAFFRLADAARPQVSTAKDEAHARERDLRSLGAQKAEVQAEAVQGVLRDKQHLEQQLAQAMQVGRAAGQYGNARGACPCRRGAGGAHRPCNMHFNVERALVDCKPQRLHV